MKRPAASEQVIRDVARKVDDESNQGPSSSSKELEPKPGSPALLDVAIRAVGHGSRIAMAVQERYCSSFKAGALEKDDTSPVTVADYAVQCLVTCYLSQATGAGASLRLVAEEDANLLEEGQKKAEIREVASLLNEYFPFQDFDADSCKEFTVADVLMLLRRGCDPGGHEGSVWVLDPIDGTKGFIRGAQYAIGLGLLENGKPVLGAMACPNLPPLHGDVEHRADRAGFVFHAQNNQAGVLELEAFSRAASGKRGSVAWPEMSTPLQVVPPCTREPLILCESYESRHRDGDEIRPRLKMFEQARTLRLDSMTKYGLVARGDAHIYLRGSLSSSKVEQIWDHAAAVPILLAAGGKVTDLKGKALDFGRGRTLNANQGVLATNGALHEEILSAIEDLRRESAL
mmetsp:Transcript_29204/g.53795  ORF Transcript_29204/g.53795 Transcript_29204/m.53795 type:complete len:401 (-) Transcript_29204:28-1230(-)